MIEFSCLNIIWGILFLGILGLVGGTSAPKDSAAYKSYAKLLGFCVLSSITLIIFSIILKVLNTTISLTVVP
jgi:hypothetical protein